MADPILDSAPSTSAKSPERRNSSILRVIIAAVAGLVVLSLLINAVRLQLRGSDEKRLPILQTADRLNQLEALIKEYVDANGRFPGETLEEALRTLRESGVDFDSAPANTVAEGRDAWDAPLVYLRKDSETLIVRSIGRNRRHENGGGDDIQRLLRLTR